MKYIIKGGKKLKGQVKISGNKNSLLPCMAAALLTEDEIILENVPEISDLEIFLKIFNHLGIEFKKNQKSLQIRAKNIKKFSLPDNLVMKLRASILLVGPLLARQSKVEFHFPGGDIIGMRSVSTHIEGFKSLGVLVNRSDLKFSLNIGNLRGQTSIFLEEASVTATENLILACVIRPGKVTIRNCAKEPHIIDLCKMLLEMGAIIEGIGSDTLFIKGVEKLHGTKFRLGDDYLEAITYVIASVITDGDIKIKADNLDLDPIMVILKKFGIKITLSDNYLKISNTQLIGVDKIVTNIWPGFPTDLMSVIIVLATQASGVTLCHDWMYESRMFFVDKLISMGANITIADPHRVLVYGPTKLRGRNLETPDIRAGMALVLAALVASGESIIDKAELIERGYEDVVGKLISLDANIERRV